MNRVRFISSGLTLVFVLAGSLHAAPTISDDFTTYLDAAPLHTQAGAPTGLAETWQDINVGATVNAPGIDVQGPGFNINRVLAGSAAAFFPSAGSSFYLSMTFTVTVANPFEFSFSSQHTGGGTIWKFGVQNNQFFVNGQAAAGTVNVGQEYTLVSRMTRVDGGNDNVVLWVDPASELDVPLISGTGGYVDDARVNYTNLEFLVAEFGATVIQVDNIAGGTTFADVVPSPIPEPSTLSLLSLAGIAFMGMRRKLRR